MKLKLISLLVAFAGLVPVAQAANPVSLVDETLTYDVIYKWGFINKVAGYATMSLRNDGDLYRASVFAENAPWANSIYMLRDTLYSTMTKDGYFPVSYTYIAHENGKYKTYIGNPFINELINIEDSTDTKIWKDESIKVLEGGKEAFDDRRIVYESR